MKETYPFSLVVVYKEQIILYETGITQYLHEKIKKIITEYNKLKIHDTWIIITNNMTIDLYKLGISEDIKKELDNIQSTEHIGRHE